MLIEEPSMNLIFFLIKANPAAHHEERDSERGERRDKGGNEALEATQTSQTKARHLHSNKIEERSSNSGFSISSLFLYLPPSDT